MTSASLATVLETVETDFIFDGFIIDNTLSREGWAKILGITRQSILVWEKDIINQVPPLADSYLPPERRRANYLDAYQRFLIAVIFAFKGGLTRGKRSHKLTINFLKKNFSKLNRDSFETWRNNVKESKQHVA